MKLTNIPYIKPIFLATLLILNLLGSGWSQTPSRGPVVAVIGEGLDAFAAVVQLSRSGAQPVWIMENSGLRQSMEPFFAEFDGLMAHGTETSIQSHNGFEA